MKVERVVGSDLGGIGRTFQQRETTDEKSLNCPKHTGGSSLENTMVRNL